MTKSSFPYKFVLSLHVLMLLTLVTTATIADVRVPPEVERKMMQDGLDAQIQGLSPAEQVKKVESMLAEIPLKQAELDAQISNPPENGMPTYMLHKQRAGLDRQAAFYREWLSEKKNKESSQLITTEAAIPPPSPLNPGLALGGCFLIAAMLLGARRYLSHSNQTQNA